MSVKRDLVTALRLFAVLAVLFGALYTLLILGVLQGLFPTQANGDLVVRHGRVVGSRLIGQSFTGPGWFHGRPSATVSATGRSDPYNAMNSGGSNLGPRNPLLVRAVRQAMAAYPGIPARRIPPSLVESSASGLDPDITPRSAYLQVPRVARSAHLRRSALMALVRRHVHGPWLGLFGHARVNVLELNLALVRLEHR